MPNLRNVLQTAIAALCVVMIAAGLYLTSQPAGEGVVLDRPGTPKRLVSDDVTATAFYEMAGDEIELTMLFSEAGDSQGVFRSRVNLIDGQRHTIVLGGDDDDEGEAKRFVFRRVGYTVEMRLDPTATLSARLDFSS